MLLAQGPQNPKATTDKTFYVEEPKRTQQNITLNLQSLSNLT